MRPDTHIEARPEFGSHKPGQTVICRATTTQHLLDAVADCCGIHVVAANERRSVEIERLQDALEAYRCHRQGHGDLDEDELAEMMRNDVADTRARLAQRGAHLMAGETRRGEGDAAEPWLVILIADRIVAQTSVLVDLDDCDTPARAAA